MSLGSKVPILALGGSQRPWPVRSFVLLVSARSRFGRVSVQVIQNQDFVFLPFGSAMKSFPRFLTPSGNTDISKVIARSSKTWLSALLVSLFFEARQGLAIGWRAGKRRGCLCPSRTL